MSDDTRPRMIKHRTVRKDARGRVTHQLVIVTDEDGRESTRWGRYRKGVLMVRYRGQDYILDDRDQSS